MRNGLKRLRSSDLAKSVNNAAVFCLSQGAGDEVCAKSTWFVSAQNKDEMKALKKAASVRKEMETEHEGGPNQKCL